MPLSNPKHTLISPIKVITKIIINLLEKLFNKKASKINGPLIKGDVVNSKASTTKLYRNIKYKPNTRIEDGLKKFAKWFIDHKNLNN